MIQPLPNVDTKEVGIFFSHSISKSTLDSLHYYWENQAKRF